MRNGSRRWLGIVLLLVPALACAPPPDSPDASPSVGAAATPTPAAETVSIPFPGPPATEYRTDRTLGDGSPIARLVRERLPGLVVDPCLQRAAAAHLAVAPELAERLPLAFTEDALHWAGCPDATATVSTVLSSRRATDGLLDELQPLVADHPYTHLGFARGDAPPPYRTRWIALLVNRRFSLRPVATSAARGATLPLQFDVGPDTARVAVAVTLPGGAVRTVKVGFVGRQAVASLQLPHDVGREWVELTGYGPAGPEVLALFPVAIGRPPPGRFVGRLRPDESWIHTPEQAEDFMASLIQRDRERFDLPRLVRDPVLAAVARAHSLDMAKQGYFAHISSTTGSVADRLRRRRYQASFVAENIAMAGNLAEAEEGLMRSPEHRTAILSRRATRFGVGVAATDAGDIARRFLVTEVFAEVPTGAP